MENKDLQHHLFHCVKTVADLNGLAFKLRLNRRETAEGERR